MTAKEKHRYRREGNPEEENSKAGCMRWLRTQARRGALNGTVGTACDATLVLSPAWASGLEILGGLSTLTPLVHRSSKSYLLGKF